MIAPQLFLKVPGLETGSADFELRLARTGDLYNNLPDDPP
jgi:hypothetical protein